MHIQRSAKASAARRVFEGIVVPMVRKCNAADDALALRPEGAPQIRRGRVATLEKVDDISCELRLAATNLGGSECAFYSLQYTSVPNIPVHPVGHVASLLCPTYLLLVLRLSRHLAA